MHQGPAAQFPEFHGIGQRVYMDGQLSGGICAGFHLTPHVGPLPLVPVGYVAEFGFPFHGLQFPQFGHLRLGGVHAALMEVPERLGDVMPVADESNHRHFQKLAELAERFGKHSRGAAEGVACLVSHCLPMNPSMATT